MVVEILRWWSPPLEGWGKSICMYQHSDTENTVLSQKSIWDLLGRTELIPGDITNLLICESLQNCLFMQKKNQKSLAFGGFFAILDFSWEMCEVYKCRDQIIANF